MAIKNPYYAYIELTLGELVFTVDSSRIMSMECSRFTSTSNNICTMTLLDETALVVEEAVVSLGSEKNATFRYGYINGAVSPNYSGTITECVPDLSPSGATITLTIISKGLLSKGKPKPAVYSGTPDEVVTQVAQEEGWQLGTIEPCFPVMSSESIEPDGANNQNQFKDKEYHRTNESALDFLKKKVLPTAQSANSGESNFKLYFDDSTDPPTINFHPDNWNQDERVMYSFKVGSADRNNEVLSFKPSINEGLSAILGASEVSAETIDALRNEMFQIKYNKSTLTNRPVTGDYSDVPPGYKLSVGCSSYTSDEMEKKAATLWAKGLSATYPAELEIIGNPNISLQSIISMIVMTPGGLPHYSSGIYLVTSVTDTIEGGNFTTSVALIRNGLSIGVDDSGGLNITASSPPTLPGGAGATDPTGSQTENSSGGSGGTSKGSAIVKTAKKYLGVPYVWGGTSPSGFDCSGFTQYVYKENGITISRSTYTQCNEGKGIDEANHEKWLPGDLLFYRPGSNGPEHVSIYIGDGKKIHAPRTGDVVKIASAGEPCIVRRIV